MLDEITPRPEPLPVHAVLGPGAWKAVPGIARVDTVFGVDVMTEKIVLLYGVEAMERRGREGPSYEFTALWFSLDLEDAAEVDGLLDLIVRAKGEHHYGRPIRTG
jgi:hypothetical protein